MFNWSSINRPLARTVYGTLLLAVLLARPWPVLADLACERQGIGEAMQVYVLAGQSNMLGLGDGREHAASPAVAGSPEPRAWISAYPLDAGQWAAAGPGFGLQDQAWVDSSLPGASVRDIFGPELGVVSFALESDPGLMIGIVKHARPATDLARDWRAEEGREYRELVRRVVMGVNALEPRFAVTISAVLWMQGESDADRHNPGNEEGRLAAGYGVNLETFVGALRRELVARGCSDDADLPFIVGRISAAPVWEFSEQVRSAQLAVAQRLNAVGLVDTDMLGLQDGAHYDSGGVMKLGRMLASAAAARQHALTGVFSLDAQHHFWFFGERYCRLARSPEQGSARAVGSIPWHLRYEADCGRVSGAKND